jgi:hypothetical protein
MFTAWSYFSFGWNRRLTFVTAVAATIVVLAGTRAQAARTGTMGLAEGDSAAVMCPNKTYLAGFAVYYDNFFSGLAPYCVSMGSDGAWSSGGQVHLDIQMSEASGSVRVDMFCARDFYLFGFQGFSHVYGIHAIAQLTLICKNVKSGALTGIQKTYPKGLSVTEWPGAQCSNDSVADGVFGYIHDTQIIQFGLSCAQTRPAILFAARLTPSKTSHVVARPNPPPPLVDKTRVTNFAPTLLVEPIVNGTVVQGQFRVRATSPLGLRGTTAEVLFTWLDGRPQYVKSWVVPVTDLASGVVVPLDVTLSRIGHWSAKARISQPTPGAWSDSVAFQLQLPPPMVDRKPAQRLILKK